MIIVDLKNEKTVTALKEAIEKQTGIPREHQLLRHNSSSGDVLKDGKTLKNGGNEKAEVFMSFGELEILVNYGKETFTSRVDKTDTVASLKKAIKERLNNTFGLALEDDQTMDFYEIKDDQNVLLSLGEFQIKVRYGEKTASVNVKDTDTVATLKGRIENIEQFRNIPPEKQILRRLGGSVYNNDSETMEYYYVKKDETVIVTWNEFEISVKYDEIKEPFTVEVKYDDTVKSLKDKIEEKFRIPSEKQKLSHSRAENFSESKEILYDDSFPICEYYIVKGETIFVSDAFQITVEYTLNDQKAINKVEVKGKDTHSKMRRKQASNPPTCRRYRMWKTSNSESKAPTSRYDCLRASKLEDEEFRAFVNRHKLLLRDFDFKKLKEGQFKMRSIKRERIPARQKGAANRQQAKEPSIETGVSDAESGTLPSVVLMASPPAESSMRLDIWRGCDQHKAWLKRNGDRKDGKAVNTSAWRNFSIGLRKSEKTDRGTEQALITKDAHRQIGLP
ncbi:hypothetical protein niasHS_018044 [Heterodera schachtii]|uniref:Ubiquitin-like domain-containing protein n=1 Tax=Heterodera schachtii TaxID=97005 RepID=A0ABD2HP86_HETSC